MKGELSTLPRALLINVEMIEPYKGVIYDDLARGTGGMFVLGLSSSLKTIKKQCKKLQSMAEHTKATYKLAKMNLAIRGISANLGDLNADTFTWKIHPDLKADYIMANPPFNQKDWRGEDELMDDPRWRGYDVPPKSNANFGWILNMVSKLSDNGVAGFILANGAFSGGGEEYKIRKKLIEKQLSRSHCYHSKKYLLQYRHIHTLDIKQNKTKHTAEKNNQTKIYRDRDGVLFMDLRRWGSPVEKKFIELSPEDRTKIVDNYHSWQQEGYEETYKDVPEFCYSASFEELKAKDFSLVPSKYIEFVDADSGN